MNFAGNTDRVSLYMGVCVYSTYLVYYIVCILQHTRWYPPRGEGAADRGSGDYGHPTSDFRHATLRPRGGVDETGGYRLHLVRSCFGRHGGWFGVNPHCVCMYVNILDSHNRQG